MNIKAVVEFQTGRHHNYLNYTHLKKFNYNYNLSLYPTSYVSTTTALQIKSISGCSVYDRI